MKRSFGARGIALIVDRGTTLTLVVPLGHALVGRYFVLCNLSVPKLTESAVDISQAARRPALKAGATCRSSGQPPAGSKAGTLSGTFTWRGGKGKTVTLLSVQVPDDEGKVPRRPRRESGSPAR